MRVENNVKLLMLNSFGVDARAERLVEWECSEDLLRVDFGGRWMALGGGHNVLFINDFAGTLVKSAARKIEVTGAKAEKISVRAEAGVDWADFVAWCVDSEAWGAENLAGIPGTVGAAPIQNIGAYGAEVQDIIESVEYFDVDSRQIRSMARADCAFGYRESVFKRQLAGKVIVTAVNFVLSTIPQPNLKYAALAAAIDSKNPSLAEIAAAVKTVRNSKLPDPKVLGNAGSFFKNPVVDAPLAERLAVEHDGMPVYATNNLTSKKLSAAWLIERAGWKGRNEGRVGVHSQQALIVVNLGGATGREIVKFSQKIVADVRAKFGVELIPEVNVIC